MKITLKQNWKTKSKKDKVRALCTLSVGNIIGVSVKIVKSNGKYFLSFPSYYNEKKDDFVSLTFPMSKAAKKNFDKLLKKFLKSGKKSCSIEIEDDDDEVEDEVEDEDDDEDNDKIYGDDDEIDEDDDDFDDIPF